MVRFSPLVTLCYPLEGVSVPQQKTLVMDVWDLLLLKYFVNRPLVFRAPDVIPCFAVMQTDGVHDSCEDD